MPEKYRNWSCQDQVVRVVPGNFVPFLFEDPRPEAVSVRVSANERFSVEGEGEFQGQEDFTFPLSSTREVRKFQFPDLRVKRMVVKLQLQLEDENEVEVASTSYDVKMKKGKKGEKGKKGKKDSD